MSTTGIIFDISHYMLEDGPGIRTNVFVKGCPLRCKWCSNAYGLEKKRQLSYDKYKCIGCGACLKACSHNAITASEDQTAVVQDFVSCTNCMACVSVCPAGARKEIGREVTPSEVLREVEKDRMYYRHSEGGVTMSGGEILLQAEFVREVLRLCYTEGISTAIETSAFGRWEDLESILEYTDTAFIDCKAIDPKLHKSLTGVDNALILENIRKAAAFCEQNSNRLVVRYPFIPTMNDTENNIRETAAFVGSLSGDVLLNILPYHNFGEKKYELLGKEYPTADLKTQSKEVFDALRKILEETDVRYSIGGYDI